MTAMHSFATRLQIAVEAVAPTVPTGWRLWLFGSALRSPHPRDVDLLLVYDLDVSFEEVEEVRAAIAKIACETVGLKPHLVVLNTREAAETAFAAKEGALSLVVSERTP